MSTASNYDEGAAEQRNKILNQGIQGLKRNEAFKYLVQIVSANVSSIIVTRIEWSASQSEWLVKRFSGIREQAANSKFKFSHDSRLREASPSERMQILSESILKLCGKIIGFDIQVKRFGFAT